MSYLRADRALLRAVDTPSLPHLQFSVLWFTRGWCWPRLSPAAMVAASLG